ncbi:MAG: glycine cleavage system aminomethyltransferase GcvT [Gammaproteobacteria bacterium]
MRSTPLHGLHEALGARFVPFAGYQMPVQYPAGIKQEHLHTRAQASLFDVSHMGQIAVRGPAAALEDLVPGDIAGLAVGQQRYSVLTNDAGGIIDDLMIARLPEHLFLVVNAAFKDDVRRHLEHGLGPACEVEMMDDRALIALQGPAAAAVLGAIEPALARLPFMAVSELEIDGSPCIVSRSGYTGEDGFEIALPAAAAERLARRLLDHREVAAAGLGARDSLRLEAGLCLSGTDIDAGTTPVAAGLSWVVARKYRDGVQAACFPGAARILDELHNGAPRVRVGLRLDGRVPLRGGSVLYDAGREVGVVTSGTFGPSVEHPVAMGYVERNSKTPGTQLSVSIRERTHVVVVAALPFVPHRYYRP